MTQEQKQVVAQLSVNPGQPLEISGEQSANLSGEEGRYVSQVGATLKAYFRGAAKLLDGKLKHIRDFAPPHLTSRCRPCAFVCRDGVVVRYDRYDNPDLMVIAALPSTVTPKGGTAVDASMTTMAPFISENFLHCVAEPKGYIPGANTPSLTLSVGDYATGEEREFAKKNIFAVSGLPKWDTQTSSTRPKPFISIRNEFDLLMKGVLDTDSGKDGRPFVVRSSFRLPVGWDALEVFPRAPIDLWNPDIAEEWAENDLLASVLQRNLRDDRFKALDPLAAARKQMARVIAGCEKLLDGDEEPLHQYIKLNPEILCPTHFRSWSKLSLGNRVTDFVFREPSGDYLLVELESPTRSLFRADGQPREELVHALDQVIDWRRYIEDNLRTVQHEMGLDGISANPSCLVVIGRSSMVDESNRRKLVAMQNSMPKVRIMTYDDLIANAKATAENFVGPLWDAGPHAEVYILPK